jgi:hypothetical protein
MDHRAKSARLVVGTLTGLAIAIVGCSGSSGSGFGGGNGGGGDGGSSQDGTLGGGSHHDGGVITMLGGNDSGNGLCVPPTCASLNATCGAVTDKVCGGVIQCGSCKAGETCGATKANQCGKGGSGSGDACGHETCASQGLGCGVAGDGCGGTLNCGSCALPQICGGNPAKPGQCGCTGTCAAVPTCGGDAGLTTTLTGKVLDPAGVNGLYNVLVYIPNTPSDPGLAPFPIGVTCDVCGATAAGDPLVTTYTAPDGTFTLSGVPIGTSVPLVIQLGKWRRQFTVPIPTACAPNAVTAGTLTMPKNHTEGDIPQIAIVSGALDPVECVLRKIGIQDTEFTNPGGGGHVSFYTASTNAGEVINGSTPPVASLFATTGGPGGTPEIDNYDVVILECEGEQTTETAAAEAGLAAYTAAGGRAFASDFAYSWLWQNSSLSGAAVWNGDHSGDGYSATGLINTPATSNPNPIGTQFQEWLEDANVTGASTNAIPIYPAFPNTTSITPPTQEWLYSSMAPIQFTYNTPIGAAAANQCGRVTFSDWHAQQLYSGGQTFPNVCPAGALTPQQAILEFMIFDLSACVMPYTPICTKTTCAAQGIECGFAGDGCGGALMCGSCATGQTCGGGGAGKCGTTSHCTPQTCAGQGIQCGAAGDGCGNEIQCGNCPTGEICGITTAGQCGSPTSK